MNCENCECIPNYDGKGVFCGKTVESNGEITTLGCNTSCDECKPCYQDNNDNKNNSKKNNNKNNKNNQLDRNEFLDFLKQQDMINKYEDGVIGYISADETTGRSSSKTNQNSNKMAKLSQNLSPPNNFNQGNGINNNIEEVQTKIFCRDLDRENCTLDKGCNWNNDQIICQDLKIKFFTSEKLEGEHLEVGVGNFNLADINNLDFYPEYIAVPKGLRVKIWHKDGYVGMYDAYLGNHQNQNLQDKHLYKIRKLGSIQVCNMVECQKPSPYNSMKLINIMDGSNVDRVDTNPVGNMAEYKIKLRKNIINRIKYLKKTQHECTQEIVNYLRHNGVNLHKNFDRENDIGVLQKVKFLLINMPSCQDLQIYKDYRNLDEEHRIKTIVDGYCEKDKTGECAIKQDYSNISESLVNKLQEPDMDIDNNMLNNVKNEVKNNLVPSETLHPNIPLANNAIQNNTVSPSPSILDNQVNDNNLNNNNLNNNNLNNNNLNNNNKNNKKNNTIRKLLEKMKILKEKNEELLAPSPADLTPVPTQIIYRDAPAETQIVYRDAPAETQIVYRDRYVPVESSASEIDNKLKFFGVKVKGNAFMTSIYDFLDSDIFKKIALIALIFLAFVLIYNVMRKRH